MGLPVAIDVGNNDCVVSFGSVIDER